MTFGHNVPRPGWEKGYTHIPNEKDLPKKLDVPKGKTICITFRRKIGEEKIDGKPAPIWCGFVKHYHDDGTTKIGGCRA